MMARPSKRSSHLPAILAALKAGATRTAAAQAAGIDPSTFQRWLSCKTTQNVVERAEGEAELRCVATITLAMRRGSWQAAAWWLERRRAQDWGKVDRLELDIRQHAAQLAGEYGLDAAERISEAERIIAGQGKKW